MLYVYTLTRTGNFVPGCIAVICPVVPLMPTIVQRNTFLSFFWTGYLHANIEEKKEKETRQRERQEYSI